MKLSVILLTKTDSLEIFEMTSVCIQSLLDSEPELEKEIIVIESNKNYSDSNYIYPEFAAVIIPQSDFNFHQFLNIGIKASKGDYIALCNNDLIFKKGWFSEILKVGAANKDIISFSPVGSHLEKKCGQFEIGYKVMTHIKGWCIVSKRELFNKIGLLDETFDFYFADNDYAMTLKCYGIKHALVYDSFVVHLGKRSTVKEEKVAIQKIDFIRKYNFPNYLNQEKYRWVIENEKNLSGFLKFHKKWGHPRHLYYKNKIADIFIKYKLEFLIRYFFKL